MSRYSKRIAGVVAVCIALSFGVLLVTAEERSHNELLRSLDVDRTPQSGKMDEGDDEVGDATEDGKSYAGQITKIDLKANTIVVKDEGDRFGTDALTYTIVPGTDYAGGITELEDLKPGYIVTLDYYEFDKAYIIETLHFLREEELPVDRFKDRYKLPEVLGD